MKKIIKDSKGITLISLVVTIIVLIILAGITISLVLGPNGIIAKAQYAKVQSEIGGEKEQLSMAVTEATLDNNGKQPTLEQIKDKIVEKGIATADNIKIGDNSLQVTTPKGHTYIIDDKGNIEYIGEGAAKVPDLTQANVTFTYTPSSWTNGNVQVGIVTTVTGFTLQYSTDGNTWNTYTSAIIASNNESIYARLWDGINYGGVTTGNVTNIDKTNPTLTLSQDANTSTRTITINATDTGSGINSIQYNNGTWQALTTSNITNGKSATYQVTANGTYTFRTTDNAGNITSQDITVTGIVLTVSDTKGGTIISTSGNTQIKDDEGNTITVPAGFKIASDSATKQEDGIVIEDKDGNQFVWVPVANISNYARTDFGSSFDYGEYSTYSETMPSDEQTSVNTYHGYYIGRYEAGDATSTVNKVFRNYGASLTNLLAIKKGQAPYNWATRDQSITLSMGMKGVEGYSATTKLCSSYAWDTAINFIQNRVSNYGTSSSQGNYLNTTFNYIDITGVTKTKASNSDILIPTGETTPVCNIYDIGGNDWEWTTEAGNYNGPCCVCRGGYYYDNYADYPAGYRTVGLAEGSYDFTGFRVTLYM